MPDKTANWPQYRSHKVVRAAKIVAVHDDGGGPDFLWVDPGTGNLERFVPSERGMLKRAEVGGYAVLYEDDFRSISPKDVFEGGYERFDDEYTDPVEDKA